MNLFNIGKENLTPSHLNILTSPTIPSSRGSTGKTFSKSSLASTTTTSTTVNKPTIGSYARSKSYIYVPSFEELKQSQQPFSTLCELFSKLDTFPTLHNDQKIEFIRLCTACIDKSFLKVHERDIYMFWIILAMTFVGTRESYEEEVKKKLTEYFEFLSSYNHPVKDEESFYILNALFEWKINEEPDKTFKSLAKIQQGIKRLGETSILIEIKASILQRSIFPQAEISYKPTTLILSHQQQQQLHAPTTTTKSTSPQDVNSNSGVSGLFTGNRRRRSNSNNDYSQNSSRQTSRSNLFSINKQSSINIINTEAPPSVSSNPFIPNTPTHQLPPIQQSLPPIPTPTIITTTSTTTISENVNKRKRDVISTPVQPIPATATPNSNAGSSSKTDDNSAKKSKQYVVVPINKKEYTVLKKIGAGGSCTVYKCIDNQTKQDVAVKHIKIDNYVNEKCVVEGFLAEATLLEQLRADDIGGNIITLLDYEYRPHTKRDEILLVLELGTTDFNNIVKKKSKTNPFTPEELRNYWRQMLEAVAFIHSKKIVHTDIKPANFLLVNDKLKLIDFGIAKVPDHDETQSISRSSIVGTLNFMPPESFINHSVSDAKYKFGPAGDIWSLGIIFFQTIYHKTPFSDYEDHFSKIAQITDKNKPPYFPPCDEQYEEAVDLLKTILVKDPNQRPSIQTILQHHFFTQEKPLQLSINTNEEQEAFCKNVLKTFEYLLSNLSPQTSTPQTAAFRLLRLCHDNKDGDNMSEDDITGCLCNKS